MKKHFVALILLLCSTAASANIIYSVNRIIGGGSVVGTIETDGSLGTLNEADIVDWTFTLTSPNLTSGSPQVFTKLGAIATNEFGSLVFATAGALTFDFSAGPGAGLLLFQGNNAYWCLQTNGCFDSAGGAEAIGFGPNGPSGTNAEYRTADTVEVFATVAAVPEPTLLSLLGLGLAGLGFSRRKRAS